MIFIDFFVQKPSCDFIYRDINPTVWKLGSISGWLRRRTSRSLSSPPQEEEIRSLKPLKEIKRSLVVKATPTKPLFAKLSMSYKCLAKTILFNCFNTPPPPIFHYSIQYFLYRWQAAYRAQLHRSVLVMVRHECAENRRRGRAARRSLRVKCDFLPPAG